MNENEINGWIPGHLLPSDEYDARYCQGWNDCLREIERLRTNPSNDDSNVHLLPRQELIG